MSRLPQFIPALVVTSVILQHILLWRVQRVVRSVERGVEKEGLVGVIRGGFLEKIEREIGDGMGGIEWFAIERHWNFPLFTVQPERVVSGEEIGCPGKVAPVALEPEIGGLLAEVPFADHGGEIAGILQDFSNGRSPAQTGAACLIAVEAGEQRDP